ncbi:MAG TPA: tetratricopeptide repeat protein [Candidatus Limnocylindria bacterium]|nr:tetratricopeptide repeat protein [Candidatus Limnocylindria bacterium]
MKRFPWSNFVRCPVNPASVAGAMGLLLLGSLQGDAIKSAISAPVINTEKKPASSQADLSNGEVKSAEDAPAKLKKTPVAPEGTAKKNVRAEGTNDSSRATLPHDTAAAVHPGVPDNKLGKGTPTPVPLGTVAKHGLTNSVPPRQPGEATDALSLTDNEPFPPEVQKKLVPPSNRLVATNAPTPTKLPPKPAELTESELRHPLPAELAASGNVKLPAMSDTLAAQLKYFKGLVNSARDLRKKHQSALAEEMLVQILSDDAPEEIQRDALYELGLSVLDSRDLPRTQQLLAQFARKYPSDPLTAEVLLRQGLLYREMGAPALAISKFYAVMSTALNLKDDQVDHYQRVVLLAQTEIADTYYLQGHFEDAADFYRRVLKLESPNLNEALIRFKLAKCFDVLKQGDKMVAEGLRFIERFPDDTNVPEIRFMLASTLKTLNRRRESIEQTMALLQAEKTRSDKAPDVWAYWQQRTGNDIGNQLYAEGDYLSALQIYRCLSNLSKDPGWEVPAWYQIALVLERLGQPEKASEMYQQILAREKDIQTKDLTPNLKLLFEMSHWRKDQLAWESSALRATREIANASPLVPVPVPAGSAVAAAGQPK